MICGVMVVGATCKHMHVSSPWGPCNAARGRRRGPPPAAASRTPSCSQRTPPRTLPSHPGRFCPAGPLRYAWLSLVQRRAGALKTLIMLLLHWAPRLRAGGAREAAAAAAASDVAAWLGRPPRRLEAFIQEHAGEWR